MLLQTLSRPTSFLTRTRPLLIAFGLSIPLFSPRPATTLDASPASSASFSSSPYTHARDARTPLTKDGRTLNPAAVKQISLGSILGLGAGLLLSAFSRSLTLLLGLGIVVWQVCFHTTSCGAFLGLYLPISSQTTKKLIYMCKQYAARKGYNFIPVERLQGYVRGVNLRSAINDNVAFKISFGLMFALAAFGEL